MLQPNSSGAKIVSREFNVMVEIDEEVASIEKVQQRLAGSLTWMEGVGEVYITYIGDLEVGE